MGIKILDKINAEQTAKLAEKQFPEFKAGDIVRVSIRVREGDKTTSLGWYFLSTSSRNPDSSRPARRAMSLGASVRR